ncbi:MAG: NUDIX hydrolase [Azoarcus sp.]|nr:NUDIX hydrolase [Azoarcus sp.]
MALHHQIIAAAVIERNGRFLLIEERVDNQLRLNQPAGRLEAHESPAEGAVRECMEESGYSFLPTHLVGIYAYHDPRSDALYLRLAYTGALFIPHAEPLQPQDPGIHAVHWMTREEVEAHQPRHRSPLVLRSIEDYSRGVRYRLDVVSTLGAGTNGRFVEEVTR